MNATRMKGNMCNYDNPLQAETPRRTQFPSRPQPVYSPGPCPSWETHKQTLQEGQKTTSLKIRVDGLSIFLLDII